MRQRECVCVGVMWDIVEDMVVIMFVLDRIWIHLMCMRMCVCGVWEDVFTSICCTEATLTSANRKWRANVTYIDRAHLLQASKKPQLMATGFGGRTTDFKNDKLCSDSEMTKSIQCRETHVEATDLLWKNGLSLFFFFSSPQWWVRMKMKIKTQIWNCFPPHKKKEPSKVCRLPNDYINYWNVKCFSGCIKWPCTWPQTNQFYSLLEG